MQAVAASVAAVLSAGGAWWLLRKGIRTDAFPPFLADAQTTAITRYSGPWLTAAAGAALLAALLLLLAVVRLVRWSRPRSAATAA